ncbi:MAG TPA: DUF882 domain-containing protein [Stellaceae bacterium]|nr:DUF882 domain-containing protein [Stellaceae bacterium]
MSAALWRRRDLLFATGLTVLIPGAFDSGEAAPVAIARPSVARRLKLKNVHTGETFEGPYRDDTGPIPNAVTDLAHFLRDFHVNKVGPLDVGTLDFLADVMDAVGETSATVLSAYRTPETNARLRATTFGVAEKSQHIYGRAIDVSFDRRLLDAETAARRMARGGVGWYPRSHFVHLDTGPTRSWELDGTGFDRLLSSSAGSSGRRDSGAHQAPMSVADRLARHRALARSEFIRRKP